MRRLGPLITTQETAELLGVSVATVRRRAVEGILPSERTRGGHRRFRRSLIQSLVAVEPSASPTPWSAAALLAMRGRLEVHSSLLMARRTRGSWWEVFEGIQAAVLEIHALCARGAVSVVDWEVALDRLRWALNYIAETLTAPLHAPLALIAAVPEDRVGVASAVLEVGAGELGWRCRAPAHVSPEELAGELAAAPIRAVIIGASGLMSSASLAALAPRYLRVAAEARVPIGFIGSGPWPAIPGLTTFPIPEEIQGWLEAASGAVRARHGA